MQGVEKTPTFTTPCSTCACVYSAAAADNFGQRFDDAGSVVQPTSCCLEERLQHLYGRVINDEEVRKGAVHVIHVQTIPQQILLIFDIGHAVNKELTEEGTFRCVATL